MRIAIVLATVAVLALVLVARGEDSEPQVLLEMSLMPVAAGELAPWGTGTIPKATETEGPAVEPQAMPSVVATLGKVCEVQVGKDDAPLRYRLTLHPSATKKPGIFSIVVDARVVKVVGEADGGDLRETRRRLTLTVGDGKTVRIGLGADATTKGRTLALLLTAHEVRAR